MARNADTVYLSNMAEKLNEQFGKHLDAPIARMTPYDWWKRTQRGDISEPLPKPIEIYGRSPVWRYNDIVRWFIRYRGVGKVKESAAN